MKLSEIGIPKTKRGAATLLIKLTRCQERIRYDEDTIKARTKDLYKEVIQLKNRVNQIFLFLFVFYYRNRKLSFRNKKNEQIIKLISGVLKSYFRVSKLEIKNEKDAIRNLKRLKDGRRFITEELNRRLIFRNPDAVSGVKGIVAGKTRERFAVVPYGTGKPVSEDIKKLKRKAKI